MPQAVTFVPWSRSGMYDLVTRSTPSGARLRGELTLTAAVRDAPGSRQGTLAFEIAGPGDVEGLTAGAVLRMTPPPLTTDAEPPLLAHCELAEMDLPWRHSPRHADGAVLRPWIVLVAAAADEIDLGSGGVATLSGGAPAAHDLARSAQWAHIQIDVTSDVPDAGSLTPQQVRDLIQQSGTAPITRLVCPRPLDPDTDYVAAIVAAFTPGGAPAWNPADAQAQVRVYHHWTFRTGEAGDFRTLCAALRAERSTGALGGADLRIDLTSPGVNTRAHGALAKAGGQDLPLPPAVVAATAALRSPGADPRGRPVIGAPAYGEPWRVDPAATTWGETANDDPRHRGVGGLGLAAGIALQDVIVDAAVEQLGAVEIANQRLGHLSAGLAASGSLWDRRLPADPGRRIALFWSSTARMATDQGTVLDRISGAGRPLPRALFSSAARRVLRPGPARTRLAAPGAADPARVLVAANRCPTPPDRTEPGLLSAVELAKRFGLPDPDQILVLDRLDQKLLLDALRKATEGVTDARLKRDLQTLLSRLRDPLPIVGLVRLLELLQIGPEAYQEAAGLVNRLIEGRDPPAVPDFKAVVDVLVTKPPSRPCRPVDLAGLAEDLTAAVRPDGWPKDRVVDTITGTDGSAQPVEVCTSIDLPAWRFLRDVAPDWLLPGVGSLLPNRVYAFESNPRFVDAFLLGLNQQALAELRWRNLRIATGCTPLRVFWGRIGAGGGAPLDDVRSVGLWADASTLGSGDHRPPGVDPINLVLVFRTDLFRRYPATLVSAIPASLDAGGDPDFGEDAAPTGAEPRHWPVFQGAVGEDVTFFGFLFTPQQGAGMWFLLEEPPPGYRFRSEPAGEGPDGATFARARFNSPTRVLIRGGEIL